MQGTRNLTGNEYRSYIKTMQHADYPSGSACYCAAWTNALRGALGTDTFDFTITFPAGARLPLTQYLCQGCRRVAGPHMHGERPPHRTGSWLGVRSLHGGREPAWVLWPPWPR